ncbi:hypothetical protein HI914_01019 [Erysiphe necator]|nr:hypothetical protein HI914_01019 [Erysiphe necator]
MTSYSFAVKLEEMDYICLARRYPNASQPYGQDEKQKQKALYYTADRHVRRNEVYESASGDLLN